MRITVVTHTVQASTVPLRHFYDTVASMEGALGTF
jgi:hypothetical protein